jgi:UDPglucose 6-dehydrogenase
LEGKTIAIWGLAFKPRTDDMREAPSIVIISQLLEAGAKVRVNDPVAIKEAEKVFGGRIEYNANEYEILKDADALVIVTEWNEYRNPDFERIAELLAKPVIFDGRNLYEPRRMKQIGFEYFAIGRNGRQFCSERG